MTRQTLIMVLVSRDGSFCMSNRRLEYSIRYKKLSGVVRHWKSLGSFIDPQTRATGLEVARLP